MPLHSLGTLTPNYYRMVRYLYMRSGCSILMSQILEKPQQRTGLIQDVLHLEKKPHLITNACLASCYVCEKGLNDGYSLTAAIVGEETVLLCNLHNSKITQ